jgi:hypothetical protein
MESPLSLEIHTPTVYDSDYDSENTTPHAYSTETDSDFPQERPPSARHWWHPIVLYPTVTNLIPMLMAIYKGVTAPPLELIIFIGYILGLELHLGNTALYLMFEPTFTSHMKSLETLNLNILDAILMLHECVWILCLPTPDSFMNGYISMGAAIAILFLEKMLITETNKEWRTTLYVASACRRAFVMGYISTVSIFS